MSDDGRITLFAEILLPIPVPGTFTYRVPFAMNDLVLAGGVSANKGLRTAMQQVADKYHRNLILPTIDLTTDNAAMIAVCAYFKYQKKEFTTLDAVPYSSC